MKWINKWILTNHLISSLFHYLWSSCYLCYSGTNRHTDRHTDRHTITAPPLHLRDCRFCRSLYCVRIWSQEVTQQWSNKWINKWNELINKFLPISYHLYFTIYDHDHDHALLSCATNTMHIGSRFEYRFGRWLVPISGHHMYSSYMYSIDDVLELPSHLYFTIYARSWSWSWSWALFDHSSKCDMHARCRFQYSPVSFILSCYC